MKLVALAFGVELWRDGTSDQIFDKNIGRSLMSSKSVERLCGKDGRWGPGLPQCKGADDDDCEPDDIDDDDNDDDDNDDDDFDYKPWHVLYLGHFLPRDPLTTSQC